MAQATVARPSAVAVQQAVPVGTTRRKGLTSPLRLRIWTAVVILGAVAVLAVTELGMTRVRSQVNVIAQQAAPQAATASDLYFALSDLDAQLARLAMIGTSSTFASDRLDALLTYQRRSAEISADLDQATRAATSDADRATVRHLLDQLGQYRELAWQAIAIEGDATDQVAGVLPAGALGYYGRATDLMHFQLLPTALRLRTSSQDTLERTYIDQRDTGILSVLLTVVLGGLLLAALVVFQLRLVSRFRRLVSPALLLATLATLATLGLVVSASVVLLDENNRLRDAQRDSFGPYLALTQAQAVSYDAAAAGIAVGHRRSFEASIAQARGNLSGWTIIPLVLMVAVMLLALIGVRPRLAEYR